MANVEMKVAEKISIKAVYDWVGKEIGTSEWFEMSQQRIDAFADVTLDHQFIHVDPEQAAKSPFGGTIAHGFFTLSLLPYFVDTGCGLHIEEAKMGLNYGFDKVRFLQPVPVNSRVRGNAKLLSVTEKENNRYLMKFDLSVEIEGVDKPALIAECLGMYQL
jgi:acyl dehydratase